MYDTYVFYERVCLNVVKRPCNRDDCDVLLREVLYEQVDAIPFPIYDFCHAI